MIAVIIVCKQRGPGPDAGTHHEHHVCEWRGVADLGQVAPRLHNLLYDLRRVQVAAEPHAAGEAELAVHGAAQLAAHADGDALLLPLAARDGDEHRLDGAAGRRPLRDCSHSAAAAASSRRGGEGAVKAGGHAQRTCRTSKMSFFVPSEAACTVSSRSPASTVAAASTWRAQDSDR